jgi:hypothetical protein
MYRRHASTLRLKSAKVTLFTVLGTCCCFFVRHEPTRVQLQHPPGDKIFKSYHRLPRAGSLSKGCSPLTVAIIGHAKSGTTTLFDLATSYSGILSQMFVKSTRKEVGCLSGRNFGDCMKNVRGPARCDSKQPHNSNLTIDAAPAPTDVRRIGTGMSVPQNVTPSIVFLLRNPIDVIVSLYNHYALTHWQSGDCEKCPLTSLLYCQLKFLTTERIESLVNMLRAVRAGTASVSEMKKFLKTLVEDYSRMACDGCDGVHEKNYFIYKHFYILDVMFEFDLLAFKQFMDWENFLVIDYKLLAVSPDAVRDSFFELLLGANPYKSLDAGYVVPSWEGINSNPQSKKKACALVSPDVLCKVGSVLKPFNDMLFDNIQDLAGREMISTVSGTSKVWWDMDSQLMCAQ